jgi:hypothetical protein
MMESNRQDGDPYDMFIGWEYYDMVRNNFIRAMACNPSRRYIELSGLNLYQIEPNLLDQAIYLLQVIEFTLCCLYIPNHPY